MSLKIRVRVTHVNEAIMKEQAKNRGALTRLISNSLVRRGADKSLNIWA